jgi:glutathione synthase/RimK-type ligase-like ATP-grasp enzyme
VVLVITDLFDETADAVLRALNYRGVPWTRLNGQDIPAGVELVLDPLSLAKSALHIRRTGQTLPLDRVRSVWLWKAASFDLKPGRPAAELEFIDSAWRDTLAALERALGEQCLFVNGIDRAREANDKPHQLRVARALGFTLPETLVTNSPDAARAFCERHREVIFKLVNQVPIVQRGDSPGFIYTTRLTAADKAALESLTATPGIFQALVEKKLDIRVTVVGDQVFAAEIHSQGHDETRVDFRKVWRAGLTLPHRVHELPPIVHAQCIALVKRLGLSYGAIDLIQKPDGDYVFLEINPSGMFGWIQHATRMPISIALADLLARGDARSEAGANATAGASGG